MLPKNPENLHNRIDKHKDVSLTDEIPQDEARGLRHVLSKETHDPLHQKVFLRGPTAREAAVDFGQQFKLAIEDAGLIFSPH